MLGQAQVTLFSHQEEELSTSSACPPGPEECLKQSCAFAASSQKSELKNGAQGHCNSQTCRVLNDTPEFLSSQCSMTVSSQCSMALVSTMLQNSSHQIFHDRVITMLHVPCQHNAPEFLSSQCSMTVSSQCSMALVITMLQNSSHHNVP